jgi:hypothetical protein
MAGKFSLDLSRLVAKANGQADTVVRKIMLETFRGVVMKTPVDLGTARANWVVGHGALNFTTSDATDKGGGATVARIASDVATARLTDGSSVFCTNSLPYALKLENGHSKQTPAGMVKLTLTEITAKYGA